MKECLIQKQRTQVLIVLAFFAFSFNVKGQSYLNKTYLEGRPLLLFSSVVEDSGNFYVTGVTFDSMPAFQQNRVYLAKLNSTGEVIASKSFYDYANSEYGAFHNTLMRNSSDKFLLTGYAFESANKLFVAEFSTLDSVTVYNYSTPNTFVFAGMKMLQHSDGFYYITGVKTDSIQNDANVVLVKIDTNGNRIWEKYYNSVKRNYAQSIIELNNGNLMLGAFRSDNNTPEHANTWLIEVDTGGTVIREWFDPNDSTYVAEGLLQTKDGGFIYGAQKKNYQTGFSLTSFDAIVVKMDSSFNKQWTHKCSNARSIYNEISDIEELQDGSFVAAGHIAYYGIDTALNGYIVKLDTSGNVIWEKTYRGISTSQTLNFLTDIDVLSTGFVAVGQCQNPGQIPGQVGWLLKLDNNGCEVENCLVGIDDGQETPNTRQIQVYPNPFSSYLSLTLSEGEGMANHEATFTITDVLARVVYQRKENNLAMNYTEVLDLSWLPNGIYLVTVQSNGETTTKKIIKQ